MQLLKLSLVVTLVALSGDAAVRGDVFLDLASVTPGGPGDGAFSGTLGGITVSGSISSGGGPAAFSFNSTGLGIGDSTIDGSSPQFSYSSVFSTAVPATDRVGFTYLSGAANLVTLTFSSPVIDPVFHFANLDGVAFGFGGTPGFSDLTILNGNNGPDSDGIDPAFGGSPYSSALVYDLNPATTDSRTPDIGRELSVRFQGAGTP